MWTPHWGTWGQCGQTRKHLLFHPAQIGKSSLDCLPAQLWHVNKINIFQDIRARLSSLVEMRCWVLALTQGRLVDCFVCHCDYYPRHKPCAGSHWCLAGLSWLALALGKLMWKNISIKGKRKAETRCCCWVLKFHLPHEYVIVLQTKNQHLHLL